MVILKIKSGTANLRVLIPIRENSENRISISWRQSLLLAITQRLHHFVYTHAMIICICAVKWRKRPFPVIEGKITINSPTLPILLSLERFFLILLPTSRTLV